MKDKDRAAQLIAELKSLAENDFERHRIDVLERDLTAPPVVEQVDEKHQRFNGATYCKTKDGHYQHSLGIHVDVWCYYHGDIPQDGRIYEIHHHDLDKSNNAPDNLELLTNVEHRRVHNLLKPELLHPERLEVTCIYCGKVFETNSRRSRFCSQKCKSEYRKAAQRETLTCPVCGKQFEALKNAHRKYCSCTCSNLARHTAFHPVTGERCYHTYIFKKCEVCGKEFPTKKTRPARACSPACRLSLSWKTRRESQKPADSE